MRGLDPRIHLSKKIDCRVEFTTGPAAGRTRLPGNDERKDGSVKKRKDGSVKI
jgi:hypothetical protein